MEIIKKIKPLFNRIIVTAERYDKDITKKGIIVAAKGAVKEYQTVIAIGSMVKGIEVGDRVEIDPTAYIRKKYDNSIRDDMDANPTEGVFIPMVEVDGKMYFSIYDRDIKYVIETEEVEDPVAIQLDNVQLIKPKPIKIDL